MAAIFDTKELGEDGTSTLERRGPRSIVRRKTKIIYYVLTDDLYEGEPDAVSAPNVPIPGYTVYRGYVCSDLDTKQTAIVKHPTYGVPCALYEIEATFDNNFSTDEGGGQGGVDDITQKRPVLRWHGEEVMQQMFVDVEGTPCKNAAGETIYIEQPRNIAVLEISRWENDPFNPNTILQYQGKRNSQTFYGAPAGAALMKSIQTDEDAVGSGDLVKVNYTIHFDFLSLDTTNSFYLKYTSPNWTLASAVDLSRWDVLALNEGYQYRNSAGEAPVTGDKSGNKRKFNLTETGVINTTDKMYFLRFRNREEVNFNNLALGPY